MKISLSTINQTDYAMYLPALQEYYTKNVHNGNFRKLPKGMIPEDLNILNPNNATNENSFHVPCALYSAGAISNFVDPKDCIVQHRDRCSTVILGDSGGFQIATGQTRFKNINQKMKEDIFHWLVSHTDVAMTLDVPTWPLVDPKLKDKYQYRSFDECLNTTLENLKLFEGLNAELDEPHQFLNVLQGNNFEQSDVWYDAVKDFPFHGGWAIGGPMKKDTPVLLYRILRLMEDGAFAGAHTWIHLLGTGTYQTAIIATCILRCLQKIYPQCDINFTFDTSSAILTASKATVYTDGNWGNGLQPIKSTAIKSNAKHLWQGSRAKFPNAVTNVGKGLKKGDIIRSVNGHPNFDMAGYLLVMANNLEMQMLQMDLANKIAFDSGLSPRKLKSVLPVKLVDAKVAIERVLLGGDPDYLDDVGIEWAMKDRWKMFEDEATLQVLDKARQ